MANRRMFSGAITNSAKFLRMPPSSRLLYYDLGMAADDDGVVEAFAVLRMTAAAEDDLKLLVAKGFLVVLDEDNLIMYINDWLTNNQIRRDRYQPSIYQELLVRVVGVEALPKFMQAADLPEPDPLPSPAPEPEQTEMAIAQPTPEQTKPARTYRGPSWGTEKPEITEEAKSLAAELADRLDARTPGAPPTSGQKKAAYARAIQEIINKGYDNASVKGTLAWLVSDAYGADYYRGRILSDAAVLRDSFKPMFDKALAAYNRAQAKAGGCAS